MAGLSRILALMVMAVAFAAGAQHPSAAKDGFGRSKDTIREEHRILERSLDDLERYLIIAGTTTKDPRPGDASTSKGGVLATGMERNGLSWRESSHVRPFGRWWLASLVNPEAREAALSLEVRGMVAGSIERLIEKDAAFRTGERQGRLSAHTRKWAAKYIALGRRFAGQFDTYYPASRL